MLALRWKAVDQIALERIEPPLLGDGRSVKVRVEWAAVCTSDFHIVKGQFGLEFPAHLAMRQPVSWKRWARTCNPSSPATPLRFSPRSSAPDAGLRGGPLAPMSEPTVCRSPCRRRIRRTDRRAGDQLATVGPGVSTRHACLIEPLACVLHAINEMGPSATNRVVITGAAFRRRVRSGASGDGRAARKPVGFRPPRRPPG